MDTIIKEAEEKLKKYKQDSVFKLMNKLEGEKKIALAESVLSTDLESVQNVFKAINDKKEPTSEDISPMNATVKEKVSEEERQNYYEIGKKVIENNEYAVVTVAGGQGTRLGHNGPKGTYKINTIKGEKSLFEILCETMKDAKKKFGVTIPWYIMTSEENNDQTVSFFESNNYFGYDKDKIKFFKQSKMPVVDTEGKLLVDENYRIKEASDGHGGIFNSMVKGNVVSELDKVGVKWVFTCGVDNPLVDMVDPYLLGLAITKNCKLATRSLVKTSPSEKIGVICKQNNRVKVIEYSELSEEMANKVNENGDLLFGESHVMFNLFSLDAIKKIANEKLPYHIAFKKNSYIDENGTLVKPEKPNSYKFESFIFDSFELFDDMAILRGKREDEFAPIKNAEGSDSPETAVKLYNDFWKNKLDL